MNYLAHLHLAAVSGSDLVGNFLGDFVKGSQLDAFPVEIQHGIRLHRAIDSFTDRHPQVRNTMGGFKPPLRRVAGIVLDVYFDHLLLRHWQTFSERSPEHLVEQFYRQLANFDWPVTKRFGHVRDSLLQHRWLLNYQQRDGVEQALTSIQRRLGDRIIFARQAMRLLNEQHQDIEAGFLAFYPELMTYACQTHNINQRDATP
ncbi:ACP phosphodiesterase [Aestuariibacter halophilus]|uniref:ACP phosphodiesterase n=1 Tax=Fluctibacter halophilus TaxID=226011 RepID=A0ABS8G962_9ALTE|nr:ACP phosphodiesterase [Aestuariibacter halophilus]MCC2617097.1 ACP phosphodiesterase [Aestuariibacter halophilus]